MEQNKNRYELIIGFVTLIISFSAFKDELGAININLGFYNFTLADYLLNIVYGFGICIYLYIIEQIARQSKRLNSWKITDYVEKAAFVIFVFIILSPILLGLTYIIYLGVDKYTKLDSEQKAQLTSIVTLILGGFSGIVSILASIKHFKFRNKSRQDEIEKEEIKELENAEKLYENKFYSHAILEAFKVLEIHLIRLLTINQINIPRNQFSFKEIFNYAVKLGLLDSNDIETIDEIRRMRNSAAHLDKEFTKQQATKSIEFIKHLIQRTSVNGNE